MPKFTVDGTEYDLVEPDRLTFAEARAFEAKSGEQISDLDNNPSSSAAQALFWISMKRKQPELKFTDLDDMVMGDFDWADVDEPAEAPDPTGSDEADPSSSDD